MKKKKYSDDQLIAKIVDGFGSVEKYAKYKGKTKSTIYERIKTQSDKFIRELWADGVLFTPIDPREKLAEFDVKKNQVGEPIKRYEATLDKLYAEIGRLQIENRLLHEELSDYKATEQQGVDETNSED